MKTSILITALLVAVFVLPASTGAPVDSPEEDLIGYHVLPDGEVSYAYRGDAVSEKLAEQEDTAKRTPFSFTEDLGNGEYRMTAYGMRAFDKDATGAWRSVEYGRIDVDSFASLYPSRSPRNLFARLAAETAWADSIAPFTGAGDGNVTSGSSTSWDTVHDATVGIAADYTTSPTRVTVGKFSGTFEIRRSFFPFDTSALPTGISISSAVLGLYATSLVGNADNDGDDFFVVVQTSQASNTQLVTADFDQAGAINNPTEGSNRIDYGSFTLNAYNNFTLDSDGIAWISDSGFTLLGVREGHDVIDSAYAGADGASNQLRFATSEATGTTNDPTLTITYSTARAGQPRYLRLGTLLLLRGTLIIY